MPLLNTLERRYYEDGGLIYPREDTRARFVHHRTIEDMDESIAYCKHKRVVIQAGGNCGIWARRFSGLFDVVYTWEPDSINFGALVVNTAHLHNIVKFQAALGCEPNFIGLGYQAYGRLPKTLNCGATYVSGKGIIPTMQIDHLGLSVCDLIYLDIEGCELLALKGAEDTIKRLKPVIACEDKGLSERYGIKEGDLVDWLIKNCGYKVAGRVRKDVVLVYKDA